MGGVNAFEDTMGVAGHSLPGRRDLADGTKQFGR